jgi:hypothetical protein
MDSVTVSDFVSSASVWADRASEEITVGVPGDQDTDGPVGGGAGLWDVERKKNISKQRFNLKHLLTFSIKLMLK